MANSDTSGLNFEEVFGENKSDSDDSVFDPAIMEDGDFEKHHLMMYDLAKFINRVNKIPADELQQVAPFCAMESGDESDVPVSVMYLYKFILNFTQGRDSFSEEEDEIGNRTGDLTGCGGDLSILSEPDIGFILNQNKTIQDTNVNLKKRNLNLRGQLETIEEENEVLKTQVLKMGKDLKSFNDKPDTFTLAQQLRKEKDELHQQMLVLEDDNMALTQRCKFLKEETEDYRHRLTLLQDQHEETEIKISELLKINAELDLTRQRLQIQCQNYVDDLDSKEEIVAQKTILSNSLQQQLKDLEGDYQLLLEEKEQLALNLKESQLEFSICQGYSGRTSGVGVDPVLTTPRKTSIEQEIHQAANDCGNYPSPLCGSNRIVSPKLIESSPRAQAISNNIASLLLRSPTPDSINDDENTPIVMRQKNVTFHQSVQTNKFILQSKTSQTDEKLCKITVIGQNESNSFEKKLNQITEENKNKENEISELKQALDSKNRLLTQEQSQVQQLIMQLGTMKARVQELQNKVANLTDAKIASSECKFNAWSDKYCNQKLTLIECMGNDSIMVNFGDDFSELLKALVLDTCVYYKNRYSSLDSLMHTKNIQCFEELVYAYKSDEVTRATRLHALTKCKQVMHSATKQKLKIIEDDVSTLVYSNSNMTLHAGDAPNMFNQLSDHFGALENLLHKMDQLSCHIGAVQQESKQFNVITALAKQLMKMQFKMELSSSNNFVSNDLKSKVSEEIIQQHEEKATECNNNVDDIDFYETLFQNRHSPKKVSKLLIDKCKPAVKKYGLVAAKKLRDFFIILLIIIGLVYLGLDESSHGRPPV